VPELSIALIQEATRGDRLAARQLVDLLLPMVHYRVARTLLRRRRLFRTRDVRQETEDLIQSVLLFLFDDGARALLHWSSSHGTSLADYIGLLAEREASSILRSRRPCPRTEDPAARGEIDAQLEVSPAADGTLIRREVLSLLLDRVEAVLNGRNLELFHLIVIEERSVEEICTLMEMTPEAVYTARSRLARIARGIAATLAAEGSPVADKPITGRG
jgi:DNA-directed RNA polymerase specialized sigma24 family protein